MQHAKGQMMPLQNLKTLIVIVEESFITAGAQAVTVNTSEEQF